MKPRTTRHVIVTRPASGARYPLSRANLDTQNVNVTMSEGDVPMKMKMVAPGLIGQDQLNAVIVNWGLPDDDGVTDTDDLLDVINHWGQPIETPPELGESTNCELGPYGGYNVLTGTERFIVGKTIGGVVRAVSMENDQTVDLLRIEDFTSTSQNYGGYGSPKKLVVKNWKCVTQGGGDDYGYRGVVPTVEADGWQITNNGGNKDTLRLTGVKAGHLYGLDVHGGAIWLGGAPGGPGTSLGFANCPIKLKQAFAANCPNKSALQLFAGEIPMLDVEWIIPDGKMAMTCWSVAKATIRGTVNGVKLTQNNKTFYIDGAPGASNVTIVT